MQTVFNYWGTAPATLLAFLLAVVLLSGAAGWFAGRAHRSARRT